MDGSINNNSIQEIATFADNMIVDTTPEGLEFVDDGAHGYLLVPPSHSQYAQAVKQKANTSYNYQLLDGTICLEEDIEAGKFINSLKQLA